MTSSPHLAPLGAALTVVFCLCAVASADEPARDQPIIPPGQEALLPTMLGRGAALPGRWP